MKIINILGINISNIKKKDFLIKIQEFLDLDQQKFITTPNPEIILNAVQGDEEFFYILNKSDIAVADGFGLKMAGFAQFSNLARITGADLLIDLLQIAEEKNKKVLVLNWKNSLSSRENIINKIKEKYPKLIFEVKNTKIDGSDFDLKNCDFLADILLVNFGAPYQEKYIYHNLHRMKSLKIAIGIGGAFDFLTGQIKRAPFLMRFFGLEWLWRLLKQPKRRIKRIVNAIFIFPLKFVKWRFVNPFLYRPNVVCFLYKKINDKYKVLLVERKNEKGHWQLPQGGTDGESLDLAGARELEEELNISNFQVKKVFKDLYKYKFENRMSKFGVLSHLAVGYKGQKQGLMIAEFLGNDEDIKVNFYEHSDWKWVDLDDFIKSVFDVRKKSAKIFLKKFQKNLEDF